MPWALHGPAGPSRDCGRFVRIGKALSLCATSTCFLNSLDKPVSMPDHYFHEFFKISNLILPWHNLRPLCRSLHGFWSFSPPFFPRDTGGKRHFLGHAEFPVASVNPVVWLLFQDVEQRNGDITYGQFAQLYRSLMFSAQKTVRAEFSREEREGRNHICYWEFPLN